MLKRVVPALIVFFLFGTSVPAVLANNAITIPFQPQSVQHLPNIQATPEEAVASGTTQGVAGFRKIVNVVLGSLGLILRSIALFVLFAAGFVLVTAQNSASEQQEKQKMNVLYTIIGLIVFGLSADFIYNYLLFNEGSYVVFEEGNEEKVGEAIEVARRFGARIQQILNYFLSLSGAGAILVLVIAGMRIILTPGNDEEMDHQKKVVLYTAIGIIIIGLSNTLVNQIVFPDGGYSPVNVSALEVQLRGLSNYLLGFLGIIIFVVFVIAGVVMVANFGNDEVVTKAKSAMKNAVIGSFVVFSAYTIVATLIRTFMAG